MHFSLYKFIIKFVKLKLAGIFINFKKYEANYFWLFITWYHENDMFTQKWRDIIVKYSKLCKL